MENKKMINIAKGCKTWIIKSFSFALILAIISIFIQNTVIKAVFFLSSFFFSILTIFFVVFFRDPEREIANGIVACADGKIREISKAKDTKIGNSIKISTFMNLHNVHVNRMPIDGEIINIKHFSGIHLPAFKKESEKNERVKIILNTKIGKIKIVLIAGTIARRIVPYIKKNDKLKKGSRIGIIRLGSRVDIYLPENKIKDVSVKKGDIVKAGGDTIAEIND